MDIKLIMLNYSIISQRTVEDAYAVGPNILMRTLGFTHLMLLTEVQ